MKRYPSKTHPKVLPIAVFVIVTALGPATSKAFDKVNKTSSGVAIKGYDTVAYHTENRAVMGNEAFSHRWNDAVWYFVSAENRDLFAAAPERYAPQYGGY